MSLGKEAEPLLFQAEKEGDIYSKLTLKLQLPELHMLKPSPALSSECASLYRSLQKSATLHPAVNVLRISMRCDMESSLPHTWHCAYTNSFSLTLPPVLPQSIAPVDIQALLHGPGVPGGASGLLWLDPLKVLAGEKSLIVQLA